MHIQFSYIITTTEYNEHYTHSQDMKMPHYRRTEVNETDRDNERRERERESDEKSDSTSAKRNDKQSKKK